MPQPRDGDDFSAAGLQLLADAGAILASSLDFEVTLRQIAELTVPKWAWLCVIDLLSPDGTIREAAVACADGEVAFGLARMRELHPLDPRGDHPVARVLRSGDSELLPDLTEQMMRGFAEGDEHAKFMLEAGYQSAIVVPLTARDRVLGTMSVLRSGDQPPYDDRIVPLVRELAYRAGLALDNARLFSELQRTEQRFEAILSNLAEAVTVHDADGIMLYVNQAAIDLLGVGTRDELTSARPGEVASRFIMFDEQGNQLNYLDMPGHRALAGEGPSSMLVRSIRVATGLDRWLLVKASLLTDSVSGKLLAVNVIEDMTEVHHAAVSDRVLAEVSEVLASSLDYEATLQRSAEIAVEHIADWCGVSIADSDGWLHRVAVAHSDPEKAMMVRDLMLRWPDRSDSETGSGQVMQTGEPVLMNDIPQELIAASAHDDEHRELLLSLGMNSAMIVPISAAGRRIGALVMVNAESGRRMTDRDLALAYELGHRMGTAIENARLYTERSRIATTLEAALRPPDMPELSGWEVGSLYAPAGDVNEVGGDFYDVFEVDGGMIVLIGDVTGHGAPAAKLTSLARYTLRTAAQLTRDPSVAIRQLNRVLLDQPDLSLVTAICMYVKDGADGGATATIACAGHPPALIIRDGEVSEVGEPSVLAGYSDTECWEGVEFEISSGDTLVLYTDGITDASSADDRYGEERLIACLREAPTGPRDLLQCLAEDLKRFQLENQRDDIAALALRRR